MHIKKSYQTHDTLGCMQVDLSPPAVKKIFFIASRLQDMLYIYVYKVLKFVRAVKLKISWEEWDYCFHLSFLEVFIFVKDF